MTLFIAHRVNQSDELLTLDHSFGVELDLRDSKGDLYLAHDPFSEGESFDHYLSSYRHGLMILNIKSERIEYKVIDYLKKHKIDNYFFLDSSFPMIKALSDIGETKLAIRFSEFEGLDTVRSMASKVSWVWVDCFTLFPLNKKIYDELKLLGLKICIVSPELQSQDHRLEEYASEMKSHGIIPDAICSKEYNFERWNFFFTFERL